MPDHVVELVGEALNRRGKAIRGSQVLVLGVAYKADIDDVRESPSLDIMEKLRERGAKIEYCDPFVPSIKFAGGTLKSVPFTAASLRRFDCAVDRHRAQGVQVREGAGVVEGDRGHAQRAQGQALQRRSCGCSAAPPARPRAVRARRPEPRGVREGRRRLRPPAVPRPMRSRRQFTTS